MDGTELIDVTPEDVIEHYGVKGQKWGVRREQKRMEKADRKWLGKNEGMSRDYIRVYNEMARQMNETEIDRINNDPRFRGKSMLNPNDPLTKAYHKEYSDTATRILNETQARIGKDSPSKKYKIEWDYDVENDAMPSAYVIHQGDSLKALLGKAEHSDLVHSMEDQRVLFEFDEDGYIVAVKFPTGALQQTAIEELLGDVLSHFGVKGMKWGVRRSGSRSSRSGSANRTRYSKPPKHLSDAELSRRIRRLEMEKKYSDLNSAANSAKRTAGKKYVHEILANSGKGIAAGIVGTATAFFVKRALEAKFKH